MSFGMADVFIEKNNKPTDNEIIKALEKIAQYSGFTDDVSNTLLSALAVKSLDLIKRQQAEIERLQKINDSFTDIGKLYSEVKAEAMTEFADRLQFRCIKQDGCLWSSDIGAELKEILEEE